MVQDSRSVSVKPSKAILFYGNSILLAGLERKLRNLPGWKILRVFRGDLGDLTDVEIVVIDLQDASSSHVLTIFEERPYILLVGVDGITNSFTLLTGQTQPLHALQDVLDALQNAM